MIIKTVIQRLIVKSGRTVGLLLLCVLKMNALAADGSFASPDKPVEYMIYQYPGVALLIQIDAIETEFEARIYGPDRALLKYSRLPSRRIGPMYQLIEPTSSARQLIVEIIPAYVTDRSRIRMELLQLREEERTDAIQAEAFRLMSRAVDATSANDSTTWAGKTYTFKRAAQVFESLGWEELRLWCEYYAAHLVYFKLGDAMSAVEMAQAVQAAARRAGFETIEMAAMQLEGMTLTHSVDLRPETTSTEKYDSIHRTLKQTAELADLLGFQSERGLALFNDGIAWEQQEEVERALEQYRLALEIVVSAGDTELANRIRNQAAFAYESKGSVSGAIEMLNQVGDELVEEDAALELAESLYEKGRILNDSFRFFEAVDALEEAHGLLAAAGYTSRLAQTGLGLGQAYYGMGQMDQAARILSESIASAPASELSSELEVALGLLAEVQRYRGDWPAMDGAREEQETLVTGDAERARFLFERAMDESAKSGRGSAKADQLLKQSQALASSSGQMALSHRAWLQRCVSKAGSECTSAALSRAFKSVQMSSAPSEIVEARYTRARILRQTGNMAQAMNEMARLIDEIRYYRSTLPGVLGGWYWGNRQSVFSEYLDLALRQSAVNETSFSDGKSVLLVLERLKQIASADSKNPLQPQQSVVEMQANQIRSLLSAYTKSGQSAGKARAAQTLMEAVQISYQDFIGRSPALVEQSLEASLSRLPDDGVFLTYCFSGDDVYVVAARNTDVRVRKLSGADDIVLQLETLARVLGSPETGDLFGNDLFEQLDSLGRLMIKPVQSLLRENVFLMPMGLLRGFPFDLLRMDGRYLAEQHQVINVMSLEQIRSFESTTNSSDIDLFFLAGDPELKRDVFSYEQKRSEEISTVTDLFVGPALHIVQGPALKRDEFDDERFAAADMIHLSIPGLIDMENAQNSVMTLSRSGDSGDTVLLPSDLPNQMNGTLAVLSLTRFEGQGSEGFSNYQGFVSDLLDSGIDSVISSLWPLEDARRARFMAAFYGNLSAEPDVATALYQTKRTYFDQEQSTNPGIWAGFQLYMN